jgi:dTDP-glucose 4,6-dehydratase
MVKRILITGGAGFVGSNFIHYVLDKYPSWQITNLDKLTYAGNLENLKDIQDQPGYHFVKGDIADRKLVDKLLSQGFDVIVNFAAETHVDRGILDPAPFIKTNIIGTYTLLEGVRKYGIKKFVHLSTPEVYGGASPTTGKFKEDSPLLPNNPYSASKAAADHICRAFYRTYGVNVSYTRFANAFGPYQYPEKLMPLAITFALTNKPIPLYGDGQDRRNWIFVDDVCRAIDLITENGKPGEAYNIPSEYEMTNLDLVTKILDILDKPHDLIKFVPQRPAHDWQYPLDSTKISQELNWRMVHTFDDAVKLTVDWYIKNQSWWKGLQVLDYSEYYGKITEILKGK